MQDCNTFAKMSWFLAKNDDKMAMLLQRHLSFLKKCGLTTSKKVSFLRGSKKQFNRLDYSYNELKNSKKRGLKSLLSKKKYLRDRSNISEFANA